MYIDHRLAPVQLLEDGRELRIAQPRRTVVSCQTYAIGLENVECVGDLRERAFHIIHGDRSKQAKATRMVRAVLRAPLIGVACLLAQRLRVSTEQGPSVCDRGCDAVAIELIERHLDRPGVAVLVFAGRLEVMMHVDQPLGRRRRTQQRREGRRHRDSSRARQELATAADSGEAARFVHFSRPCTEGQRAKALTPPKPISSRHAARTAGCAAAAGYLPA